MELNSTSDAVDEVVNGDHLEILLEQLDDAVGADVAAAAGHLSTSRNVLFSSSLTPRRNKLECLFVPGKYFQASLVFVG